MTTARVLTFQQPEPTPALHLVPDKPARQRRTNSSLKSDGKPKATPAEPIRAIDDIGRIQEYFLEQNNFRNYMLVTLGINFALRAGDLLSLQLQDIYSANGKPKERFFMHEEKTSKRREVNINSLCREILEEYWQEIKRPVNMADPLFPSRNRDKETGLKKPITIQRLNQILAEAQEALDIADHMSSHCLRKTHAYQTMREASNKQEALYAMQRKLNHSDARVTMIYCGIEDDIVRELDEKVGGFTGNVRRKKR